jgi:hypothetical protein
MAPKSLSILCFGDSLTSGYYAMGLEDPYPYSITFAAKIQEALPDTKIYVHTNGKPGDVASFQPFRQRLEAECECNNSPPATSLGLLSQASRSAAPCCPGPADSHQITQAISVIMTG